MSRRALLAAGAVAAFGEPLFGGPSGPSGPSGPVPLPSRRISEVDVAQVLDLTRWLGEAGRSFGSKPELSSAAAFWVTRLLEIPGAEPVRRELLAAVANLHLHAGWATFDAGLFDRAMHHYNRALRLAAVAEDPYLRAVALSWVGVITAAHSHPDGGVQMLQFAQVKG